VALFHSDRLPRGCAMPAAFPPGACGRQGRCGARASSRGAIPALPCRGIGARARKGDRDHLVAISRQKCARPLCRGRAILCACIAATARGSLLLCAAKERSSNAPVPPRVWVSAGGGRHGPDAVSPSVASGCRPGEVKLLPSSSSHGSSPATPDRRLRPACLPSCSVSVRPSVRAHPSSRPCGFVAAETPRCSST
jgi:hypothetical protein